MSRYWSKFVPLALVLVMVLSVGAGGAVAQTSGNDSEATDTYVVTQGSNCYELATLGDGTDTVNEFYEYHPNSSGQFSSHGTTHLQESQVSQLFVYNGEEGTSLVFLHDEYGDDDRGGAITMDITGLPEDGTWPVEDDNYGENTDDNFDHSETSSSIDWMWSEGRNDGGAFLGLGALGDNTITIDPAFGEESWAYQERPDTWSHATDDVEWNVRTGKDELEPLGNGQSITIERGTCSSEEHTADLTASPDEPAIAEQVTLNASASTGDIVAYYWDIDGDGAVDETTTDATLRTSYDAFGSVEPAVFAEASSGENATATMTVTVSDQTAPEANADASTTSVAPDESIEFDANASTDNVGIDSYEWDFDDGSESATGEIATHAYENEGEYKATLTVTDEAGNPETDTVTISVETTETDEPSTAALDAPESVTVDEEVSFDASGSTADTEIVEYKWDLTGDGTVDATTDSATTTHTYTSAGDYDASVTVVDSAGNENTDSVSVSVADDTNTGTDAAIEAPTTVEISEDVELDASASTAEQDIETYQWDVDGDGTVDQTTSAPKTTTTYKKKGDYQATVTVVDTAGNENTAKTTIAVTDDGKDTEPPTATIDAPSKVEIGESFTAKATNLEDSSSIKHICWYVDGEAGPDGKTMTVSFEKKGTHTISLMLEDAAGNDQKITKDVKVVAPDDSSSGDDGTDDSDDGKNSDDSDDSKDNDDSTDNDDSKNNDDSEDFTESDDDDSNDTDDSEDSDDSDDSSSTSSNTDSDSTDETDTGIANISVTTVQVNDTSVQVGDTVNITATVENNGTTSGSQTVPLMIGGPDENETTNISDMTLNATETQNITHSTSFDEPGEYTIHVANDTVALTVHAVETATESPTETATPSDTPEENETTEESSSSTPAAISGLGIATGIVTISIGAIALYRRY